MPVIDPEIDAYAAAHTTPPPEHLQRLADETRATLPDPEMLTGPVERRFLEMLVFATRGRRILEIGAYSGYSALSMAQALALDGRIVTCELAVQRAGFARRHI